MVCVCDTRQAATMTGTDGIRWATYTGSKSSGSERVSQRNATQLQLIGMTVREYTNIPTQRNAAAADRHDGERVHEHPNATQRSCTQDTHDGEYFQPRRCTHVRCGNSSCRRCAREVEGLHL
ncbi:unnamed protein product [Pylaiella littoralis]